MTRRLIALIVAVVAVLALTAAPAGARELLGCDGVIQWPCPGPVLW